MSFIVVDVEADGPIPYKYSMICFGAVLVTAKLDKTFYGKTKPISDTFIPSVLAVSGITREQHDRFDDPKLVMLHFKRWINDVNRSGRPIFISDNPAFDWQ